MDLLATGELFFNRADRFPQDEQEGIPPEEYIIRVRGLNPLDVRDRLALNNDLATLAQFREPMYVNCWYLFDEEKAYTWEMYGEDCVAVVSTYSRLKAALDALPPEDDAHLGLVRYGMKHLTRYNTMMFITTKREEFANDREVRAMLWIRDDYAGINRHYDINNFPHSRPLTAPDPARVKDFHRRKVDIATLVTEIVVNPKATPPLIAEVQEGVRNAGYAIPVRESDLARYCRFLPFLTRRGYILGSEQARCQLTRPHSTTASTGGCEPPQPQQLAPQALMPIRNVQTLT